MAKCKFCFDEIEYDWKQVDGKWKLASPINGSLHQCKRNKPTEISASTVVVKKKEPEEQGHDPKIWKKDWTSEMDLPSERVCGICQNLLVLVTDCPYCQKFKLNPCSNWCVKCDKHPNLINVRKKQ